MIALLAVLVVCALPLQAGAADEVSLQNAFTDVAEKVGPTVVTIAMERTGRVPLVAPGFRRFGPQAAPGKPDPFEEFIKTYFGNLPQAEFKQQGLGSGVIINKEGYIVTNQHVIENATKITAILSDGRSFPAQVIGEDRRSDLAVIKIEAANLPVAELGDSDRLKPGQWTIAIGNPFGYLMRSPEPTITVGVISALHRSIPVPANDIAREYMNLIQTDAAINPGNSGGPLCDLNGKVIGINVAVFSQAGGSIGMNFAIPVNMAKKILEDLMQGRKVAYGWLGILIQDITPQMANYFGLSSMEGILIAGIYKGTSAEKSGLKPGDVITKFNGAKVADMRDLTYKVLHSTIGEKARICVIRDKKEKVIEAVIEPQPGQAPPPQKEEEKEPAVKQDVSVWRGIRAVSITEKTASQLGPGDRKGVAVIDVEADSPAYISGLRPGDIIREMNRGQVTDLNGYRRAAEAARGNVLLRTDKGYFIVGESEK
ncbi:MAG: Do family serine endopeptidase [Candidatus Omnitrophica bacterium]|nr:Do family serine endopeptidase [Candidatus Omnitrophota bacterium]